MTCTACGRPLPEGAAFCLHCGAGQPLATAQAGPPPLQPRPDPVRTAAGSSGRLRDQVVGGNAFACARVELASDQAIRRVGGRGTVLLSSSGAVVRRTLPPGARYVVDTGHVVAFEAQMPHQERKAARSGWLRSFLSGESLVAEFTGPGDLWLQTRNLASLAGALFPLFPSQGRGGGAGLGNLFD